MRKALIVALAASGLVVACTHDQPTVAMMPSGMNGTSQGLVRANMPALQALTAIAAWPAVALVVAQRG